MLRRRHLTLCLGAAVALVAGADARAAVVSISDTQLTPKQVTIAPGDRVHWTNTGTAPHTIASKGRPTFQGFTVAPGKEVARQFGDPGTYRYTLDAKIGGKVKVLARASAPKPSGGTSAPPCPRGVPRGSCPKDPVKHMPLNCDQRRVFRYTVHTQGKEKYIHRTSRDPGEETTDYRYVSAFVNVPMLIERPGCAAIVQVTMPPIPAPRPGHPAGGAANWFLDDQTSLSLKYDNTIRENAQPPEQPLAACHYQLLDTGLEGQLSMTGVVYYSARGAPQRWTFDFLSITEKFQNQFLQDGLLVGHRQKCPSHPYDVPNGASLARPQRTLRDLEYLREINPINLAGKLDARHPGRPAYPLDELLRGRSFTFDSGPQRDQSNTTTSDWSMKIVFQRLGR